MNKASINCFTGSITHIVNNNSIQEQDIITIGGGYLLSATNDEYGLPELTFKVEDCGLIALNRLNIDYKINQVIGEKEAFTVFDSLASHICWVNSKHLEYSSMYSKSLGYQHAMVVNSLTKTSANIFDPLIVDIPPCCISTTLSRHNLLKCLTDKVSSETQDLVGKVYALYMTDAYVPPPKVNHHEYIMEMKQRFFNNIEYQMAVYKYIELNVSAFKGTGTEGAMIVSRRIFDHLQVLYVIPLLKLLSKHDWNKKICIHLMTELDEWKRVAMMALKNSKLNSKRLNRKIIEQLKICAEAREIFWRLV